MSLNSARGELLAALEVASIDTYYGWGAFAAPCARIFPGEPWVSIEGGRMGGKRLQRWEVWAIAGAVDSHATFDDLEALVQSINDAMNPLAAWAYLEWRRPTITDMGGAKFLACRGVIETNMEV